MAEAHAGKGAAFAVAAARSACLVRALSALSARVGICHSSAPFALGLKTKGPTACLIHSRRKRTPRDLFTTENSTRQRAIGTRARSSTSSKGSKPKPKTMLQAARRPRVVSRVDGDRLSYAVGKCCCTRLSGRRGSLAVAAAAASSSSTGKQQQHQNEQQQQQQQQTIAVDANGPGVTKKAAGGPPVPVLAAAGVVVAAIAAVAFKKLSSRCACASC